MTGITIMGIYAMFGGQYKEITWRDFLTNYLNRGVVSKITIYQLLLA